MEIGIKHLHHFLPFIFYIVLLVVIVKAYMGKFSNLKKNNLLTLTLILAHTQLLLGLIMLIPLIKAGIDMGSSANRFVTVEHPLMMLIGVVLLTIGKVKAKKIDDLTKANKTIFVYFWIALVMFVLRTPWEKLI